MIEGAKGTMLTETACGIIQTTENSVGAGGTEMMEYGLYPISINDREPVIDIFNYYVENSFAAYPETKVPYEFFDMLLKMSDGYPRVTARDKGSRVIGFGMLRAHNPMPTFSRVAEITYFIGPEHTGKGIGTSMLKYLVEEARKKNITSILASISSRNQRSIAFHEKNGFKECGRFQNIGRKNGEVFDVVWMQKML
jgi:L-amino acid N-acyltransferase YncA